MENRLAVPTGAIMLFFGLLKFVRPELQQAYFELYPPMFMPLIGIIELLAGAALLLGRRVKAAALALVVVLIGAVISHFRVGADMKVALPLIMLVLTFTLLRDENPPAP